MIWWYFKVPFSLDTEKKTISFWLCNTFIVIFKMNLKSDRVYLVFKKSIFRMPFTVFDQFYK